MQHHGTCTFACLFSLPQSSEARADRFYRPAILLIAFALWLPAMAPANTPRNPPVALPANPFLISLVQRELAAAPADGAALAAIYRRQVKSLEEAATFFYSGIFLRLHLAGQRQVIDGALALDPITFLPQTDFLPISLRDEYRQKALAAAEAQVLRRLSRLSLDEEASLYLPSREGMASTEAGAQAFDRQAQVRRFLRDKTLRQLAGINNEWVAAAAGPFWNPEALLEAKVIAARNLSSRGLSPSRAGITAIFAELAAARAALAATPLFKNRQVVFAAGRDHRDEGPTFGKRTSLAALAAQNPASLTLLRSGQAAAERQLARAIAEADRLTLIFEMHGRPDALEFSGALRADELAAMFAARQATAGPAIVIVNTCFGHDFARAFAARLAARGASLPIVIVPEEFGQATVIGRQENGFTRDELGFGRRSASTFADLWQARRRETAVYAPSSFGLSQIQ